MKTWFIVVGAVVAGMVAGAGSAWWELATPSNSGSAQGLAPGNEQSEAFAGPMPIAYVPSFKYDFGQMQQGAEGSHDFVVENIGHAPLTFGTPQTTCKCTVGELKDGSLLPGEKTMVTMSWTAQAAAGRFSQTATIPTNDPKLSQIDLTVSGEVRQVMYTDPTDLVFSTISPKEPATAEMRLYAAVFENLEVTKHRLSDPTLAKYFDVQSRPLTANELSGRMAKSGCLVQVTTKPGLPLGHLQQKIYVQTNLPNIPEMPISVHGIVVGDISIAGKGWNRALSLLELGTVPQSEGAVRKLSLLVRGPHRTSLTLELVKTFPDALRVTVGPMAEANPGTMNQVPVTIEIPKGTRPMSHMGPQQGGYGEVILRTNHPDIPEVRIPVEFAVQG